jgi:hypothetical protein
MYVAATHLIENLACMSIRDFLRQRIWEPLAMEDTYLGLDDVMGHHASNQLAKGYGWDDEKGEYFEVPWPNQPEGFGAGEMESTAVDYARFLRCMIHQKEPISKVGHLELIKPRTIIDEHPKPFCSQELYALGWAVYTYHGEEVVEHDGSTNGFGSLMIYLPQKKWGVIIFGNTTEAAAANNKICWMLIDDLLAVPEEKRFNGDHNFVEDEDEQCKTIKEPCSKTLMPVLPLALPLSSYAGAYEHDGYGTLVVECKDDKLEIDATDRSWRSKLTLTHVSGNCFAAEQFDIEIRKKDMLKAEFRLDVEGFVGQFGIALIPDLEDHLIWFRRTKKNEESDSMHE